jgi:methylmalonyl-CoA/ethylmalonyl-CoA epimerase
MAFSSNYTFDLKPHHCGISVPDLEASIAWYRDMLGFSVKALMTLDAVGAKIGFMRHGDFEIELFEVPGASLLPDDRRYPNRDLLTHGTKHIAFEVENLKSVVDTLKERGVNIAMDVTNMPDGKVAFIRDNTGTLIELLKPLIP